ncbi:RAB1A, member RAS oncogene family [Planoprotostelium fungivorum]|uniref:RAB1A, member RAS oncogene family n=1 Tax=Planoprotostelium fungivorum TaxID=1890364 RepID=A0A2P6NTV5_9EUKA|nr:RAB1A, member RAS oncogene family [Planoprotostelium fungivorum]
MWLGSKIIGGHFENKQLLYCRVAKVIMQDNRRRQTNGRDRLTSNQPQRREYIQNSIESALNLLITLSLISMQCLQGDNYPLGQLKGLRWIGSRGLLETPPLFAHMADYDYHLKLVLLGDSGVGRTSLLNRFVDDSYTEGKKAAQDFRTKTITIGTKVVKLQVLDKDEEGIKKQGLVTVHSCRGAQGIMLVYDSTNPETFKSIKQGWIHDLEYAPQEALKILVATKTDHSDAGAVDKSTAQEFAESYEMQLVETSAKNGDNVEALFSRFAAAIIKTTDPDADLEDPEDSAKGKKKKGGDKDKDKNCIIS